MVEAGFATIFSLISQAASRDSLISSSETNYSTAVSKEHIYVGGQVHVVFTLL